MAAIGNIRKHSTFLIIIIGVALAAFVLGDFAKGGGGSRNVNVGEIEGEEITIMEFNSEAERNINAKMEQQKSDRLSVDEIFSVKEQTWNDIVHRIIMDNEYDELGLSVSGDELFDLIQGPNPHALIKQYFADPTTKQYDRNMVIQYLQNMESLPDDAKLQWVRFEKYIKEDRLRGKFNSLIASGYYVPTDLAKVMYKEKNDKADIDYVAAKFIDIKDSLFNPTNDDYADYYNENKDNYEDKAARDIDYVVFNIIPSAKDVTDTEDEMKEIAVEFQETVDVPRFVKVNSDNSYDSSWFVAGSLPVQIDSLMFNSEVGTVSDVYMQNNEFHIARLMEIGQRPDSMKASHILIGYVGAYNVRPEVTRDHEAASELADSLLDVLNRKPSKMAELAKAFSNDPSVEQNDGDLGMFADGAMVTAFNQAVYDNKVGDFTIAETPFGFHVIEVTGKKDLVSKVKVAMIDREIYASDKTYQDTFAKASKLATESQNEAGFNDVVKDQRLNKRTMPGIREMTNYIAGLKNPRQIIRWAFNDETSVGQVSSVFDLEEMFVVAVLVNKVEAGYPTLDQVKERIKQNVYNKLKGEHFVDKMNEFNGDIGKIKASMDVVDKHVTPLFFNSRNLPGFTIENEVIGTVFGTDNGKVTKPIIGTSGVFVVKVNSITNATDISDYSKIVAELREEFKKRVDQDRAYTALKESIEIVDTRMEFY